MISTKDLSGLPNAERLKNFCKGLAALDIIMLEEEWSFIRHYTYNPAWRKGKEAFFATDGSDQSMIVMFVPEGCVHNAHMYFIKARNLEVRTKLINYMKERGVMCVFHYVPLHTSPAGQKFGVFHGEDKYTTKESERLMRLPMFYSLSEQDMAYVVECLMDFKEW